MPISPVPPSGTKMKAPSASPPLGGWGLRADFAIRYSTPEFVLLVAVHKPRAVARQSRGWVALREQAQPVEGKIRGDGHELGRALGEERRQPAGGNGFQLLAEL